MRPELPCPPDGACVVALVGAESSGKTWLTQALAAALPSHTGLSCIAVPEALRDWCEQHGRTPRAEEQADIAREQATRITQAAEHHALVMCDTTPLMTAAYHHQVFGLDTLDAAAMAWHRRCDLTLLMALDLPWQADAVRDGPAAQRPVDDRVRHLLITAGQPFTVVAGQGEQRLQAALDALSPLLRERAPRSSGLFSRLAARDAAQPAWRWACDCDAPECEHQLRQQRSPAR